MLKLARIYIIDGARNTPQASSGIKSVIEVSYDLSRGVSVWVIAVKEKLCLEVTHFVTTDCTFTLPARAFAKNTTRIQTKVTNKRSCVFTVFVCTICTVEIRGYRKKVFSSFLRFSEGISSEMSIVRPRAARYRRKNAAEKCASPSF